MRATEAELRMLDQVEVLLDVMAKALDTGDRVQFLDALSESVAVDRRLDRSREATWSVWFAQQSAVVQECA
ncbi:MAG: hypothetical protein QM662_02550 [Gordonia sp. (in: high G+C Gram-positive bacteria)]